MLGWALAKQHRFADAEPLLLSYAAALQNDPSVEGDPLEVMRRIVDMYTAWGRTEDAAEWRTKLEKKAAETSSTNSDGR